LYKGRRFGICIVAMRFVAVLFVATGIIRSDVDCSDAVCCYALLYKSRTFCKSPSPPLLMISLQRLFTLRAGLITALLSKSGIEGCSSAAGLTARRALRLLMSR
jgi:hypothetical protein